MIEYFRNLSAPVGIYLHIPFCRSKCAYCTFVSSTDASFQQGYIDALADEIAAFSGAGISADTVYIGGGTPSCLFVGALKRIFASLRDSFNILDGAEITVECNPESCDARFIEECLESGVNRISVGMQSSDNNVLKRIGRIHDFDKYVQAIDLLHRYGISNISSDLILGLPEQTESDIIRSVEYIAENCQHASVYALSVEQNTPLQRSGYVADDDEIADLYNLACEKLFSAGFSRYEVSNFSKPGKESRHNRKYWTCEPYIGLGVAAHGYDGRSTRFYHSDDIAEYIEQRKVFTVPLTEKDRYNEYIMLALRTEKGIDLSDFNRRFGYEFETRNSAALQNLKAAGYIIVANNSVKISPDKMFVMNGIIEELML